jgi:hypothetical protein
MGQAKVVEGVGITGRETRGVAELQESGGIIMFAEELLPTLLESRSFFSRRTRAASYQCEYADDDDSGDGNGRASSEASMNHFTKGSTLQTE